MVHIICDSFEFKSGLVVYQKTGKRYITLEYDKTTDKDIIKQIEDILDTQPRCNNCVNYQSDGYFCGYESHSCKIHGNIEWVNHPRHDGDGDKCNDYKRINDV